MDRLMSCTPFYDEIAGSGYGVAPVEAAAKPMKAPEPKLGAVRDETVWIKEGLDLAQSNVHATPIGVGDGRSPSMPTTRWRRSAWAGCGSPRRRSLRQLTHDSLGK
jgi:hypothetical protein